MSVVFVKVLEIFAILAIGYIANKKRILPDEASPYLVSLLLTVTSPCLILTSTASKKLTEDTFVETIYVLVFTTLFFLLGALLARILMKWLKVGTEEDRGVLAVIICSVNSGFMGFPISLMIFGQEGFYYMVICNITLTFYLYSLGCLQMGSNQKEKPRLWDRIRPMCNLCILSAVIGVFLLFTGIRLPEPVFECMEMIGSATIPLAMIVVGVLFGQSDIRGTLTDRNLLKTAFLAMVVWPALTFGIMYFVPIPVMPKVIIIFSSAFPSAAIVPALAQRQGKNAKLAAQGVSLTTLVSLVTIPVMAILLIGVYGMV